MPDARPLSDDIRSFLGEVNWATVATVNEDGSPHQAVVWFLLEADCLVVNSRRGRRWSRNLEHDDRVHVAVHDRAKPQHWVGLRGRARVVRTGDAAMRDIETLAKRYGDENVSRAGQERVTFEIEIERTFEYWS